MSEIKKRYLTMQINQGKLTLEQVKEKYPNFKIEE